MSRSVTWSHEIELPAAAGSASCARDFVCLHLGEHDLTDLEDDVRLVVSELATNALRHALTPFTVLLREDGRSVLLTVQDGSSSVPVRVSAGGMDTGGRGLSIVEALSDDWGVTHRRGVGKSVWASFVMRSDAGRATAGDRGDSSRRAPSQWRPGLPASKVSEHGQGCLACSTHQR